MKTPWIFILTVAAFSLHVTALAAPGFLDLTFDPTAGGALPGFEGTSPTPYLRALALESDGRVYVGGDFTALNGEPRPGVARLLSDGTLDRTFQPPWTNALEVFALARQSDGELLLVWDGSNYNYPPEPGLGVARLNSDGSLDTTFTNYWSADGGAHLQCLALQPDGKFLVGGEFMEPRTGVARFNADGTLDETFTPPPLPAYDGTAVETLVVQPDQKILVGGSAGIGLLRLNSDGTLDTSFEAGLDVGGSVYVIQLQPDGRILVGGSIDCTCDDNELHNVVRLLADGGMDESFSGIVDIVPRTLALQPDGCVLAAGERYGDVLDLKIFRLYANGSRDTTFQAWADDRFGWPDVNAMLLQADGKVLIAGAFSSINSLPATVIARLYGNRVAPEVIAWGSNYAGQTDVPPELTNAINVAAGMWHGLALTKDGGVVGWMNQENEESRTPPLLTNAVAISSQGFHDLALLSDGTVLAWGRWWTGLQYEPVTVPVDLRNVVAIAAGWFHNVALLGDGTVVVWGMDEYGQTDVPWNLIQVVQVAVGLFHSVALRADGTVVAWGWNEVGQCDVPPGLSNVVAIACGQEHTLALKVDGTVVGWGQFWDGTRYYPVTIPQEATNVVSISSSSELNLALRNDDTLIAWGVTSYVPTNLPPNLTNILAISAGGDFGLVIVGDGKPCIVQPPVGRVVYTGTPVHLTVQAGGAWPLSYQWQQNGTNLPGATNATLSLLNPQLSDHEDLEDTVDYTVIISNCFGVVSSMPARLILQESPPVALSQSGDHAIVRGESWQFEVQVYGSQPMSFQWIKDGVVVPGATERRLTFTNVQCMEMGEYRLLMSNAVGTAHSIGIMLGVSAGVGWGANNYGQSDLPRYWCDVAAFAGGIYHSVALKADGTLATAGGNEFGQRDVPESLTNAAALAVGPYHTLAVTRDGNVVAWGDSSAGRTDVPVGLSNVIAVAAGALHSLALLDNGTVAAWGSNLDYNDQYVGQATVPLGLSNVVAIAAGDLHSVAVRSDGFVIAWGDNSAGQTNVPPELTNAVTIAAAGARNVAIRADSTLLGWGQNASVPMFTNVVAVALGEAHLLALKADGTVVTWDPNEESQHIVPEGLSNVVSIAAGRYHSLALIGPILRLELRSSAPSLTANGFKVSVPTMERHTYALEYRNSLDETNWTQLPAVRGYGYGIQRTLADPVPAAAQRFYRVHQTD